jgi:site-specific recombinase XerD
MIKEIYKEYIKKFYEFLEIRDLTENTVKNYTSFLLQYLTWVDANLSKSLEDVSYKEIRSYILFLKKVRKLKAGTINSHISQLKFFHIYVLDKSFNKYQVPFMKITRKLPVIYSKDVIFKFIDSFKNIRHKAYAALLYSSGIRVSELQYLKYEDISRKNMLLYIRKTKSRTDRYAILSKNALKILTQYWFASGRPTGFLFPGYHDRNKPVSKFTINRAFNDHSKAFGVKITPHLMRHHFGTHMYEAGYDLLSIQKLLGHKSIESTTIYVQLANPNKANIVSPFDSPDKNEES